MREIDNFSQQDSTISAAIEAHEITEFFGIEKKEITVEIAQVWNGGKIKQQVENFKMIDAVSNVNTDTADTDMALASFNATKQAGIQAVNQLAPGLLQGETAITAEDTLALFDQLKKSPVAAGVGMIWNIRNRPTDKGAIKWLGVGLKQLGLWVDSEGRNDNRRYRVRDDAKVTRAGRVTIPGLLTMQMLATGKGDSSPIDIGTSELSAVATDPPAPEVVVISIG